METLNMKLEALQLNGLGFKVIPVQEDKTPPQGFKWKYLEKTETQPKDQVRRFWNQYLDHNIAILTGGDFFVIDADNDEAIQLIEDYFPETPNRVKTGKGEHFYYSMPNGVEIGNSSCRETKIDIRGNGGYVLAPPSLHGERQTRYKWKSTPKNAKDLPCLNADHLAKLYELTKNKALEIYSKEPPKSKPHTQQVEPKTLHCQSDFKKSGDVVSRDIQPVFDSILRQLQKVKPNGANSYMACCPAHPDRNPSLSVTYDEVQGNILMKCFADCSLDSICASLGVRQEDLFRERDIYVSTGDEDIDFPEFEINTGEDGLKLGVAKDLPKPEPHKEEGEEKKEDNNVIADKDADLPEFPKELLDPPGLVGDICRYINENSFVDQPVLALAASLSCIGALLGHRVETQTEIRSNIYTMGMARSGGGKEWPRTAIERILEGACIDEKVLGGEQWASDSGLVTEISKKPTILYQIDEFGKYTSSILNKNAQSHISGIITVLMSIFEKPNKKFRWKQYADQKRDPITIDQPNVCLFGTTIPQNFWSGVTKEQVIDGFLNRFLVFQSDKIIKKEDVYIRKPPKELIDKVAAIWAMPTWVDPDKNAEHSKINVQEMNIQPKVLFFDDDAADLFKQFSRYIDKEYLVERGEDTIESALWRRSPALAMTVALIIAGGCFAHEINGVHSQYAIDIVKASMRQSEWNVKRFISDTVVEKNLKRVFSLIKDRTTKGVTKTELVRKTQFVNRMVREDILKTLIEGDQVFFTKELSNGDKPVITFFAKAYI